MDDSSIKKYEEDGFIILSNVIKENSLSNLETTIKNLFSQAGLTSFLRNMSEQR